MNRLALTLVIIGAINWGILSIAGLDLVGWLFGGQGTVISRLIYGLVGLAADRTTGHTKKRTGH